MSKTIDKKKIKNKQLWGLMQDKGIKEAIELAKGIYDMIDWYNKSEENRSKNLDNASKTILRHLYGTSDIKAEYIKAYCNYFKCSADYLLGFIDLPTHKYNDIHEETGLSKETIDILVKNKGKHNLIDGFIQSEEYLDILGINNINQLKTRCFNYMRAVKRFSKIIEVIWAIREEGETIESIYEKAQRNETDHILASILPKLSDPSDIHEYQESVIEFLTEEAEKVKAELELYSLYHDSFAYQNTLPMQKYLDNKKKHIEDQYDYFKYKESLEIAEEKYGTIKYNQLFNVNTST